LSRAFFPSIMGAETCFSKTGMFFSVIANNRANMNNTAQKRILLFLKYPERGTVKSRLAVSLSDATAAELYKCFVLDTLAVVKQTGIPVTICFYPPGARAGCLRWLGTGFTYREQRGHDLGRRMKNSFREAYEEGYHQVMILGTDSPDLPGAIITEAFTALTTGDCVIGPAADGGYYLIGFKKDCFLDTAFDTISWSTGAVFEQTMGILNNAGLNVHVLPVWNDVDTADDLAALIARNGQTAFCRSHTCAFLARMGFLDNENDGLHT